MSSVGAKQDIRHSQVPLGTRVSLNLTAPPHEPDETIDEFYARVDERNREAGDIVLIHTYYQRDGKDCTNVYNVGHAFISLLMREKDAFAHRRINVGGLACFKCTRVHYFDRLAELEAQWKASGDEFNREVINFRQWATHDRCAPAEKDTK